MDREETDMRNDWRKASYSNGSGQCVEAASATGTIAVRDTANPLISESVGSVATPA